IPVDVNNVAGFPDEFNPLVGSDIWERMPQEARDEFGRHQGAWLFSQFLHGEQGALTVSARIVESVPDLDSKFYAATQVMDEARHVAFGRLALKDYYAELTDRERAEREEFVVEGCYLMRDRFKGKEIFETLGMPVKECMDYVDNGPIYSMYQSLLFSRIVP